jgi:hypothetical protein
MIPAPTSTPRFFVPPPGDSISLDLTSEEFAKLLFFFLPEQKEP